MTDMLKGTDGEKKENDGELERKQVALIGAAANDVQAMLS